MTDIITFWLACACIVATYTLLMHQSVLSPGGRAGRGWGLDSKIMPQGRDLDMKYMPGGGELDRPVKLFFPRKFEKYLQFIAKKISELKN